MLLAAGPVDQHAASGSSRAARRRGAPAARVKHLQDFEQAASYFYQTTLFVTALLQCNGGLRRIYTTHRDTSTNTNTMNIKLEDTYVATVTLKYI